MRSPHRRNEHDQANAKLAGKQTTTTAPNSFEQDMITK